MQPDIIACYDRPVPRYTSYPTAPHFTSAVDAETYRSWLAQSEPGTRASLYLHVPFCHEMCWYCGCNMRVVRRPEPIAAYVDSLIAEIDAVAGTLPALLDVGHIHFGGGSPNTLAPGDIARLLGHLRARFRVAPDTGIAVELDPRTTTGEFLRACAEAGVNRTSLGVQSLDPDVQRAVNRIQPFETIARVAEALDAAGIADINIDLMYGLPRQTVAKTIDTVERVLSLAPARFVLFGYAHVPWMKKHMALIDATDLPDGPERWAQSEAAAQRLADAGYVAIGMDHFARPGTALAEAARRGVLNRNFQGYTTDDATLLLGFGASAIGALTQGYVQNDPDVRGWRKAVAEKGVATVRGKALAREDRIRRAVIERLMCDMAVDLQRIATEYGTCVTRFVPDLARLDTMRRDGLVEVAGATIRMTPAGRPLVRSAAAAFDRYLDRSAGAAPRHARAV